VNVFPRGAQALGSEAARRQGQEIGACRLNGQSSNGKTAVLSFRSVLLLSAFLASPATGALGETLDDAIGRALASDPSLASARTDLDVARANLNGARVNLLPNTSASAAFTRSWSESGGTGGFDTTTGLPLGGGAAGGGIITRDTGTGSLSASATVFDARLYASVSQARANYERTEATVRGQEDTLVQQVVTAYTGVVYAEETLRIRRESVERLQRQVDAAQTRFEVGAATRTDVFQAQAQLAQARADLASAQSDLASQRATYLRRVGEMPGTLQPVALPPLPASLEEALRIGRDNSTSIQAAAAGVKGAKAQVRSAYAGYLPTLTLSAGANRRGDDGFNNFDNDDSSVSARLSIPLFSFGRNEFAVGAAKANERGARYDLDDAGRALDEATTQAWARLEASRLRVEATRAQLDAANFAANGAEIERREGLRTELDVLTQIENQRNAALALQQAVRDEVTNAYLLLQTIGRQVRPAAPTPTP
jgi:outer membrane protein